MRWDDPLGMGVDNKPVFLSPPDQGEPDHAGQHDSPVRWGGAGDQKGNAHHSCLDEHLRGDPSRGDNDPVGTGPFFKEALAVQLIDGIVPSQVEVEDLYLIGPAQCGIVDTMGHFVKC